MLLIVNGVLATLVCFECSHIFKYHVSPCLLSKVHVQLQTKHKITIWVLIIFSIQMDKMCFIIANILHHTTRMFRGLFSL